MSNLWFRLYHEFADDPKVQMMTEAMQRRLVMLFCERCKGETFHETERAFHWRVTPVELGETKAVFVEKGFVDGDWNLLNWNRRQFLSDSSTERVRRHRQAMKQDETLQKQDMSVTVTAPDTDTDTDTDTEQRHKRPLPAIAVVSEKHPDMFIYEAYPRREGRAKALKAITKAVVRISRGEGDSPPCDATTARKELWKTVARYAKSPAGQNPDKTKIPHPATWFNESRYLDDQSNWNHVNGASNGQFAGKTESSINAANEAIRIINQRAEDERNSEVSGEVGYPTASEVESGRLLGSG